MAIENYMKKILPMRLIDIAAAAVGDNYHKVGYTVGTDAAEAGGSDTILVATGHAVSANDLVMFFDGDEESEMRHAESVTTDLITLGDALSGTPSAGEQIAFLTPDGTDAAEAAGSATTLNATGHAVSAGDLFWMLDGGETAEFRVVASVNANDLTLNVALSGAPSDTEAFAYKTPDHTGAVESGTTDTIITDADHAAVVGDLFVMTSGGEINELRYVTATTATTFTLNEALSGTPSATETYALVASTGTDAIEAGASTTRLIATAHAAQVGDEIVMSSGDEDGEAREVSAVGTDYIDLEAALSGAPSAAETFTILRPVAPKKVRLLHIDNTLNQPVRFSVDGSTDHLRIAASSTLTFDLACNNLRIGSNQTTVYDVTEVDYRQYLYVKVESTAPTSGTLYISMFE